MNAGLVVAHIKVDLGAGPRQPGCVYGGWGGSAGIGLVGSGLAVTVLVDERGPVMAPRIGLVRWQACCAA